MVDEEEEGVFGAETDSLTDEEVKLANSEIGGYQVLFLV